MSALRCALAAAVLAAAGCASVDETPPPAAQKSPEPPQVAVVEPAPVERTEPPAAPESIVAPPSPQISRASQIDALLTEFARLRRLPAADLAREQELARQQFIQTRTDASRVRLAMALATPGQAASDDARALELLDPLVKTPGASLHALAFLMAAYIQEQRRLTAQVSGLQQNVQGLQQNVHGLQQKLDAIKSLERSLSGRGEPARRR